ncbi:MAG: ATP-binding protein [Treponema sp.]|nr:ATP-binding protein [Treponema sp.]
MNRTGSNNRKQKNRLAAHTRIVNMVLLFLVLVLLTVVSGVIINRINNENARNIVRTYSMEAADKFFSYISQDLTLVRKAAHSRAITAWFANEGDQQKKFDAMDELSDYAAIMNGNHFYLGIHESMNEYSLMHGHGHEHETGPMFMDVGPHARLDQQNPDDIWYFDCINSDNVYSLNIDVEKATNMWHLWINHKVLLDGKFLGIFCSGLGIPDVFYEIFSEEKYNQNIVRGYIIDRRGVIQSSSIDPRIYHEEDNHIHEESSDPAFAAALGMHIAGIQGVFGPHSRPQVLRTSKRPFEYVAIEPIGSTDWSVVVFYNGHSLAGVANLVPLLVVMLSALFLYVVARNAIVGRIIFTPLDNLIQSVSEGKSNDADFFGKDRDDEIGDLARVIRDASYQEERQEQLLQAVNSAAAVLLAPANEEDFDTSLMEGLDLIGRCVDVDRLHIWRNEMIEGELTYINQFSWVRSDCSRWRKSAAIQRRYSEVPELERRFLRNEYINGPVSQMPAEEQAIFIDQGVKSFLGIPLYLQKKFYGYFSFDDCHEERVFTNDEVNILRSAGLMLVSAVNRNTHAAQLNEAHQQTRLLLDAMPFACNLWDKNLKVFGCNEENVRLFDLKDKDEFINCFEELSPEYQPSGVLSTVKTEYVKRAFAEGRCVFNWMHQKRDGTPIPTEMTLVRVDYDGDYAVAGYVRDLREQNRMLNEIQRRDSLLHVMNHTATALLSPVDESDFEASLLQGLELIGRCVDADRINIWRNDTIDGVFCYVNQFQWLRSDASRRGRPAIGSRPYRDNPEWEKAFIKNECINGPVSARTKSERDLLGPQGVKSILAIPLHWNRQFYGFFSLDDCHQERTFSEDEVNILRSAGLMMVNAFNRNTQATQLREAHEHTTLLLDTMPMTCNLFHRDAQIFDCNEAAVKLFETKDKQGYLEHFWDFSPFYQMDGQLSSEKAAMLINKAFNEGRAVSEWTHKLPDGTLMPVEVTLVRVKFGDDDIVAGYSWDLREHKRMVHEIEQGASLLNTVNHAATILLQSEIDEFNSNLHRCMGMMAESVVADRVCIWKNHIKSGKLYCTQIHEWLGDAESQIDLDLTIDVSYGDTLPGWERTLSRGDCINSLVRDMSPEEQAQLAPQGIKALFVAPVFVHDKFWGYVGFDNCHSEKILSESEEFTLRSGSMLIATALLRNEMTLSIRDTAAKLEAVIAGYAGIIWCVDTENKITLFNGMYLNELGFPPDYYEGMKIEAALLDRRFFGIHETVPKTFAEGPQDLSTEIEGKVYRTRTTPIYNDKGRVVNVVGTFDDVTERNKMQMELKAALKEAQEANNAKTSFLARMSHEMRTPLNAVIGLSTLMMEDKSLVEEVLSNLEKINSAGSTLLSTVNDILDISKIEAGKFEIIPVQYDIPSLINDAITQSIMRIGDKPIQFRLDINGNLPSRLYGDDLRVKQVLNNLLSNAFKYTWDGSVELGVNCERDGDTVWMTITVKDTGMGIRKEDMDSLFADYVQMDTSANRKIEGTGLGLSITKKIAVMMDGTVDVQSEYGKGSVFTVKLRQGYVNDSVIGDEVVNSLKGFHYSDQKRRRSFRTARVNLSYARVLLVDDVTTNLDVAKGMMKPYGMQIDCVTSGQDAINMIRAESVRYNAIFMDHMMPDMDGIEATRIIREEIGTEYAKNIPIIALTANAILGNEALFLDKGFQAFLTKPIEIERLDMVIREWVRDKELEKSLAGQKINIDGQEYLDVRSGDERRTDSDRRSGGDRRTFGKRIHGLDIGRGIERFSGDEESFLQVLQSYANNTPPLLEKIVSVNKDNLSEYAVTVHGIKGASNGICAEAVGAKAEALEKAAKDGDISYVMAYNVDFMDSAKKLIKDITGMLEDIARENPKPKKEKPDSEALGRLLAACDAYNMDGVDAAMEEIECYEYESDGGLSVWLRENVNQMNFAQITERLSALAG